MFTFKTRNIPALVGVLAILSGAGSTAYAGNVDPFLASRTVNYSDLDLNTPAGLATLYQRISSAAARVCPGSSDISDLHGQIYTQACRAAAVHRAVQAIGSPMLAQVEVAHSVSHD